jgi:hypothetical protein
MLRLPVALDYDVTTCATTIAAIAATVATAATTCAIVAIARHVIT